MNIFRRETNDRAAYPVAVFLSGERIHIEHRFPCRLAGPIALDAGPAPKPALVLIILPEIIDMAVMNLAERKTFVGGQDRQRLFIHRLETRVVFEDFQGARILLAHPVERLFAFNGLKPQKRIVVLRWRRRSHDGKSCRRTEKFIHHL